MNYVGKLLSNFKGFYNEINSATLTGAIDIIIVQQEDGTYTTSPWHARFGKLGVLRSREKVVDIEVNGEPVNIQMKLGDAGEAFFVNQRNEEEDELPDHLATSPLPDSLELMERGLRELHERLPETVIPIDEPVPEDNVITPTLDNQLSVDNFESAMSVLPVPMSDTVLISPELTKELSIVVDLEEENNRIASDQDQLVLTSGEYIQKDDLANSESHFQPVCLSPNSVTEIGIQTDMSGAEVETKTSRTRLSSANSCQSNGTAQSASSKVDITITDPDPSDTVTHTHRTTSTANENNDKPDVKLPSFIRLDSQTDLTKRATKERKRRRRKKSPASKTNIHTKRPSSTQVSRINQLDLFSTESGSSGEYGEEALFEMDLSEDEVDNAMYMNTMGRTVSMPMIERKLVRTDEWATSQYAASFHPFSDGDITPLISPVASRPPSPKSDTEFETTRNYDSKYDATSQTHLTGDDLNTMDSVRWRWGELPESDVRIQVSTPQTSNTKDEEKPSGGLFRFMRKTKKIRHQPEQEGIYLDDLNLNEMDPEVAALYLYQGKNAHSLRSVREEDNESGRGASLPQSPITVDESSHMASNLCVSDMSLSLCGGLKEFDGIIAHDKFLQSLVTYDEFCENPSILANPNLVIKMADKYYNYQTAGPIIMSVLCFQRPLLERTVDALIKQHMPKKEAQRRRTWMWGWGRSGNDNVDKKDEATSPPPSNPSSAPSSPQKSSKKSAKRHLKEDRSTDDESDASVKSEPKPPGMDALTAVTDTAVIGTVSVATQMSPPIELDRKEFRKTLKLSSEQIADLKLKPGVNEVSFSVTTQYQGTSRCTALIYLWKWDDRIIISDIDGTITKSDVLGQVLPMIGKDWSQAGIANLYNRIDKNGYKFMYLSARAIGQSKITRDYLKNVRQGELSLPDGPLLLSPSSLISAFHKEVIERRPQDFKISCLRDIKALFPPIRNPFYAGFGNKINDVWSYQAVNIPITRIFTVNHRGELRHEFTCTFQSSYTTLTDTVDHFFPPLLEDKVDGGKIQSGNFPASDEYSTFTYWREPLPDIEVDIEAIVVDPKKPDKKKK